MRKFLQFLLIIGIIVAVLASISLMPMSFVAKEVMKKLPIKPISSSEYGYIDLLKMKYMVKNFLYFGKVDDFLIMLKAKNLGSGITDKEKFQISDCKIYIFTKQNANKISSYVANNLEKFTKNTNLSIENCTISLRNIDESDYKKLQSDKFDEEKILNIQSNISLDLKDFNLESANDNEITKYNINFARNTDYLKLEYTNTKTNENFYLSVNDSMAIYKNDSINKEMSLNIDIKNSGNIIASLFCLDKSCEQKFQKITSPFKISGGIFNSEISGKSSGLIVGDFIYKDGLLKINGDIDLLYDTKTSKSEDSSVWKKQISLYSILQNIKIVKKFAIKVNNIKIDQKITDVKNLTITSGDDLSKNFAIQTAQDAKIPISGSYMDSTIKLSIQNLPFEAIAKISKNLDIADFNLNNKQNGSLSVDFQKGDWSWYMSRFLVQDSVDKDLSMEIIQDECVIGCKKNITFKSIDLSKILDIDELKKRYSLGKYFSITPGVQSAMMYMKHDETSGRDFERCYFLNFENVSLFDKKINSGNITVTTSDNKKNVKFDKINSDFFTGDLSVDVILKDGDRSNIDLFVDAQTMYIKDILGILSDKNNVNNTNILLPSLVGFDGSLKAKIGKFSDKVSNVNFNGTLENGQLMIKSGKMEIDGNNSILNISASLSSKPIFDIGIGFEKAEISGLLGLDFKNKIRGFFNVSGSFQCEGFSIQELKNSLNGALNGMVYNLEIDNFNLQALSNSLINIRNTKSINLSEILIDGTARFKSANTTIEYDNGLLKTTISNAKSTGASLSGFCNIDHSSSEIQSCQFMAGVVGVDLSTLKCFYNLQISNAISGNLSNPVMDWNFSQIEKYLTNAGLGKNKS